MGFENNKGESIGEYFAKLAQRSLWVVLNISKLELYTDVAPVLVNGLKKKLIENNGDLFLCEPTDYVKAVLESVGWNYEANNDEAIKKIDLSIGR